MALLPHTPQFIEAEVSDRTYGDTAFKQKARFIGMTINQQPNTGFVSVLVQLQVQLYANVNGTYGEPITGKGISTYNVTLVADNNCAVDPATGEVKYIRQAESAEEWTASMDAKPENLLYQGDFFEMLMHSAPVEIAPMLMTFIMQADSPDFNKFA